MIPILFESTSTAFTTHGIGAIKDAVSCEISHEINGEYELLMTYPTDGEMFDEIKLRRIILAKPDYFKTAQPFRIYRITTPMRGMVDVYARHIAYDMAGIPVKPCTAASIQTALQALQAAVEGSNPFTLTTTRTTAGAFKLTAPRPLWRALGGEAGSILDVYGGEWDFDGFTATCYARMGTDSGVQIRYGKNLTDLTQEANIEAMYTGVYPFWTDRDGNNLVQLTPKIINIPGTFDHTRIYVLDLSEKFEEQPTTAQLQAAAEAYIADHDMDAPEVGIELSFEVLSKFEGQALLEQIDLGDTLTVIYEKLGIQATARAVKTVYNVLLDRYESVTIGKVKSNLAGIIAAQEKEVQKAVSDSDLEASLRAATERITGANGGYVVQHFNASGEPTETLWMDTNDEATAVSVIRANYQGIGLSTHGVNGPYTIAMTAAGILANAITTGTLNAALIKAGVLKSQDAGQNFYLDLSTGEVVMKDGHFSGELTGSSLETVPVTRTGSDGVDRNYKLRVYENGILFASKGEADTGFENDAVLSTEVSDFGFAKAVMLKLMSNDPTTILLAFAIASGGSTAAMQADRIGVESSAGRSDLKGDGLDFTLNGNTVSYPAEGLIKPVNLESGEVNLTANTWTYTGIHFSVPAGKAANIMCYAEYLTVTPDRIGITHSASSADNMYFEHVRDTNAANTSPRVQMPLIYYSKPDISAAEEEWYVWVRSSTAGKTECYAKGTIMTVQ